VLAASRQERVEAIERASTARPLSALGRRFPVLYADPPWQFGLWSEGGMLKAAEMHISRDRREAGARYHARDAVLFMWAVSAMLPDALDVVKAWGFEYKIFAVATLIPAPNRLRSRSTFRRAMAVSAMSDHLPTARTTLPHRLSVRPGLVQSLPASSASRSAAIADAGQGDRPLLPVPKAPAFEGRVSANGSGVGLSGRAGAIIQAPCCRRASLSQLVMST